MNVKDFTTKYNKVNRLVNKLTQIGRVTETNERKVKYLALNLFCTLRDMEIREKCGIDKYVVNEEGI